MIRVIFFIILLLPNRLYSAEFNEDQVKAAYLYRLPLFLIWEEPKSYPISICTIDERKEIGQNLFALIEKGNKHDKIKVLSNIATSQIRDCDIVFISESKEAILQDVIVKAKLHSAMTTSDIKGFTQRGGILGFVRNNGRITFDINQINAGRNGIVIDVDLLGLAERVVR